MEEREALKRQIDLLQNLINTHKSVHGDAPSSSGQQWHLVRQSAPTRSSSSSNHRLPTQGGPYPPLHNPQPTGYWKKTYSLSNKTILAQHSRLSTQTAKPSLEQQVKLTQTSNPSLEQLGRPTQTSKPSLEQLVRPTQTPKPSLEQKVRPTQTPKPSLEQKVRPTQTPKPSLEQKVRPTQTPKPSLEQQVRPTQTPKPSLEQQVRPTQTSKPSLEQQRRPTQTAKSSLEQQFRPTQTAKSSLEQPLVSAAQNASSGFLSLHATGTLQPHHSSKDLNMGENDGSKDPTGPGSQRYVLTGGARRTRTGTASGPTDFETEPSRRGIALGGLVELGVSELTGPGPPEDQQREREGSNGSGQTDLSGLSAKANRLQSTAQLHIKPRLTGKTNVAVKPTVAKAVASNSTPIDTTTLPLPLQPLLSAPLSGCLRSKPRPSPPQEVSSPQRHSMFTWVKSHQPGGPGPSQDHTQPQPPVELSLTPIPVSHPGVHRVSSPSSNRRTSAPIKKVSRRLSLSTAVPKTSRYSWVSSSTGGQARLTRKPLSAKAAALALSHIAPEEGLAKKPKSPNLLAKHPSSRYRWKAWSGIGGQTGLGTEGGAGARRGSVFRWSSEKQKGAKGLSVVLPAAPLHNTVPASPPSPGGFKLRSRMKIIRRSASSGSGLERRSSPAAMTQSSPYSLRRRTHPPVRSPAAVRRTLSRELVSFGRHKLRRLSASPSKTGPASTQAHASQRVFRTRYKIVTRLGGAAGHTPHYSHALSWRAKRIQTARSVLQSRLRPPGQERHPAAQNWRSRGRGMRWIGGTLYSVSANKLSRTVAAITPINRTVRWSSPQQTTSTTSSTFFRPSSTRFVASRVVQRSLAIIRHARQKKPQRHYCMYYNRFGKCNRGNTCPYIHDPDKVAVCTRFLRGTCKQTDGTCPFSHKVAKEKMPVCSYFLKGICNNSSCPYSHVYVSRKAAVCQDFIRGYCPQGEKCKKKHTLVCPDFSRNGSCPRGAKCQLQHRQRAKRSAPTTGPSASLAKKAPSKSPVVVLHQALATESSPADPGPPLSSGAPHVTMLPSFISLSSSPEEAYPPDTPPANGSGVPERILQIKPRL